MLSPDCIRIYALLAVFALFLAGLRRHVFGTVAFMALVYCKFSEYYHIIAEMKLEVVCGALVLSCLLSKKNENMRAFIKRNTVNKLLILFVLCVILSFSVSWNYQYSWDHAIYIFFKVVLLYAMVLLSVKNEEDLKIFIWAFILMFAYLAYEPAYGFITKTGGSPHMYGVVYVARFGPLAGHVALANNMNQMIPIAVFLAMAEQMKLRKVLLIGVLVIFFTALVGSKSRGGVMGLVVCLTAIASFSKKKIRNGVIILTVIGLVFIFSNVLKSTAERIDSGGVHARLSGLFQGIGIIEKGNILGVGPGCFKFARGKYFKYTMEAHNLYGQMLGELGIPGTVIWILLIKEIFKSLSISKRRLKRFPLEDRFIENLILGIQVSLIVRLFVSFGSMGLFYFYWYTVAALSVIISWIVECKTAEDGVRQEY